jgi:hypothetical protein
LAAGDFFAVTGFSAVFLRGTCFATALAVVTLAGAGFAGVALAVDTLTADALAGAVFLAEAAFVGTALTEADCFTGALAGAFTAAGLALAAGFLALLDTGVLADFLAAVATIDSSVVKTAREKLAADYAMFTPCKGPVDHSGRCRP